MHDNILCMNIGMLCMHVGILYMHVGIVCSMNAIDVRNIVHVKFDKDHPS